MIAAPDTVSRFEARHRVTNFNHGARKVDADEAMKLVEKNGFDHLHMSFYKNEDIGHDGVWDIWQIEGPAMLWFFRGAPHVHTWVHVREKA